MGETSIIVFFIIGAFFTFVAGIGILRLPDVYLRMSATTKVATLGVGFTLLATTVYFDDLGITSRALAIIAFIVLTAPVSAHMIARAAYFDGVPLWEGTEPNELRGRYDEKTHILASPVDRTDASGETGPAD